MIEDFGTTVREAMVSTFPNLASKSPLRLVLPQLAEPYGLLVLFKSLQGRGEFHKGSYKSKQPVACQL